MFVNAAEVSFEAYDVLIVGSGPAGVTLAKRLETHGKKSLIIETGAEDFEGDLQDHYSKVYAHGHYGEDHWGLHWIRAFGGTSAVWGGWCAPLTARNLAPWPITAAELDLYYPEAAQILGRTTDFLTYEAPFMTGFAARPFSTSDEPLRIYDAYLEDLQQNPQIDVLLKTNVTALFANEARTRITGLRVFTAQAGQRDISLEEGQELVLAAGGLGNAHILLASRSGGDVAVGNENDQVGRYLMEHPHFLYCARMVVAQEMVFEELPESFGSAEPALVPTDDLFEQNGRLDASFQLLEQDVDLEDHVEQYIVRALGGSARAYDVWARSEMPPDPLNRVTLAEGHDPSGMPRLRANCVISGDTLRTIDTYLRQMGGILAREGKGRMRIDNEVIYRAVEGGGHIMGTTRMGDDPGSSVVDGNCRVHGYSNLSIAGSSVFTTGGYANPTLTLVALALRLGDHLGESS
ncbi:GMC family oxidoreductase [uncultured Roseobacter sp.]|uniref:GMC oxidoreductase n=1 Tax=uncultured Roseobacter sp. TaxID=114847 RepID=UPI0026228133|nr:GMC family oxidoreductase [uncultured Roseobacter sp.]